MGNYNFKGWEQRYRWLGSVINTGTLGESSAGVRIIRLLSRRSGVIGSAALPRSTERELVFYRDLRSCITWNERRFSEASQLIAMEQRRREAGGPTRDEAGAPGPMSDSATARRKS